MSIVELFNYPIPWAWVMVIGGLGYVIVVITSMIFDE